MQSYALRMKINWTVYYSTRAFIECRIECVSSCCCVRKQNVFNARKSGTPSLLRWLYSLINFSVWLFVHNKGIITYSIVSEYKSNIINYKNIWMNKIHSSSSPPHAHQNAFLSPFASSLPSSTSVRHQHFKFNFCIFSYLIRSLPPSVNVLKGNSRALK